MLYSNFILFIFYCRPLDNVRLAPPAEFYITHLQKSKNKPEDYAWQRLNKKGINTGYE